MSKLFSSLLSLFKSKGDGPERKNASQIIKPVTAPIRAYPLADESSINRLTSALIDSSPDLTVLVDHETRFEFPCYCVAIPYPGSCVELKPLQFDPLKEHSVALAALLEMESSHPEIQSKKRRI